MYIPVHQISDFHRLVYLKSMMKLQLHWKFQQIFSIPRQILNLESVHDLAIYLCPLSLQGVVTFLKVTSFSSIVTVPCSTY